MNKPEPMTDETLEAIWNSDTTDPSDHGSFYYVKVLANAIIAARDAQWEQMLAGQEPVAWRDMAFATLGAVRDKMHPANVLAVQQFLRGEYAAPQPAQEPNHTALLEQALEALDTVENRGVVEGIFVNAKKIRAAIAAIKEVLPK